MHPLQKKLASSLQEVKDSITGVWVDPQEFNALENGAPYFPETRKAKIASEEPTSLLLRLLSLVPENLTSYQELGILVGVLRAASIIHQTHHWQTHGANFYGDHLLFERIYNESIGLIDSVAERAVGLGGIDQVNPVRQAYIVNDLVNTWSTEGGNYMERSWYTEAAVLGFLKSAIKNLEAKGQLTDGTDNLLQGVADAHEQFTYLLLQRANTFDYR